MSEFECRNGHIMSARDRVCRECGCRVARMDGLSRWELAARERAEQEAEEECQD